MSLSAGICWLPALAVHDWIWWPQAAIVQNARGSVVFVVGPDSLAAMRPVTVLQSAGLDAVVSGVEPGERIVLDGRQNLRPGSAVIVREGASAGRPGPAAAGAVGAASGAASARGRP